MLLANRAMPKLGGYFLGVCQQGLEEGRKLLGHRCKRVKCIGIADSIVSPKNDAVRGYVNIECCPDRVAKLFNINVGSLERR